MGKDVRATGDVEILRKKILQACAEVFGESQDVKLMLSGMATAADLLMRTMVSMVDFPHMSQTQRDDMRKHVGLLLDIIQKDVAKQKRAARDNK